MQQPRIPSPNGHYPAPPTAGGAGRAATGTRFPEELADGSLPSLLSRAGRAELLGMGLLRWIVAILLLAALLLWLVGGAARGFLALGLVGAAALLLILYWWYRRRDFAHFEGAHEAAALPQSTPLQPSDKAPVWVTGTLGVERRVKRFYCLPAFYRTFATREHVIIGGCIERRVMGIVNWAEADLGLWYAFLRPEMIRSLRIGTLRHGRHMLAAIEITYDAEWQIERRTTHTMEILWIATRHASDLDRIVADLLHDPLGVPSEKRR